ncbi:MAG: hypothetical protein ACLFXM_11610 [Acidimicrobiia bacterium]
MNDRIERLKNDAAGLNVSSSGRRDGLYQAVGAVCMVAGVVIAFVAYQISLYEDESIEVQSLIILAITMLALAVAGAAVFVRYSLARFLRFWLLRQLVEGQDHIDQLVGALAPERATGPAKSVEAAAVEQPVGEGAGTERVEA